MEKIPVPFGLVVRIPGFHPSRLSSIPGVEKIIMYKLRILTFSSAFPSIFMARMFTLLLSLFCVKETIHTQYITSLGIYVRTYAITSIIHVLNLMLVPSALVI